MENKPYFEAGATFSNKWSAGEVCYLEAIIIRVEAIHAYPEGGFIRWQYVVKWTRHVGRTSHTWGRVTSPEKFKETATARRMKKVN